MEPPLAIFVARFSWFLPLFWVEKARDLENEKIVFQNTQWVGMLFKACGFMNLLLA